MATSYTSDKKIGALDPITGTLSATDELVVNKNGDTLKTSVAQVEEAMFASKTSGGTPQSGDVVVVRRGSLIRQLETQNLVPDGAITKEKIAAAAGIEDSKLAKITTAGKVGGGAITDGTIAGSTAVNTSGAIATSSTLAAGNTTITGNATVSGTLGVTGVLTATGGVSGNVSTATTLQTARTIAISGDVTGSATSFNGSADITIPAAITADSIVNADINSAAGIVDTKLATIATAGKVSNSATTATNANTANAIVARDASGNFSAGTITANVTGNLTGTASAIADGSVSTSKIVDGAVTAGKLAAGAAVPAGAVMSFAMNSAPSGWLACNGSNVSRSTYAALFSAIGTTYGVGDGSTTFALPDLRGYFVRGFGTNADATASGTFGAKQADAFGSHTHTASTGSAGAHTHTYTSKGGNAGSTIDQWGGIAGKLGNNITTSSAGAHTHTVTVAASGDTETRPNNIAMLYCIKF